MSILVKPRPGLMIQQNKMLNGFGCFANANANFANDANFADQVAKWSQEPKMPRKLLVDDSSDLSESDPEPVDSEQGYETATVKDTDTDTDSSDGVGVGVADNANAAEDKVRFSFPLTSY